MKHFNAKEEKIIRTVYRHWRPMAMREITTKTGIAWVTVRKCCRRMVELGVFQEVKENIRVKYRFNDSILN